MFTIKQLVSDVSALCMHANSSPSPFKLQIRTTKQCPDNSDMHSLGTTKYFSGYEEVPMALGCIFLTPKCFNIITPSDKIRQILNLK